MTYYIQRLEDLILLGWQYFPNWSNFYENLGCLICRNCQIDFKIHMDLMIKNSQNNHEKKRDGTLKLCDLKTFYKATIIKGSMVLVWG